MINQGPAVLFAMKSKLLWCFSNDHKKIIAIHYWIVELMEFFIIFSIRWNMLELKETCWPKLLVTALWSFTILSKTPSTFTLLWSTSLVVISWPFSWERIPWLNMWRDSTLLRQFLLSNPSINITTSTGYISLFKGT